MVRRIGRVFKDIENNLIIVHPLMGKNAIMCQGVWEHAHGPVTACGQHDAKADANILLVITLKTVADSAVTIGPEIMFLCCGEALYDLVPSEEDLRFVAKLGGSPLNVAIGIARLGRPSAFLGAIGNDGLAERMLASLAQEHVDTSLVTVCQKPTSLAVVTVRPDGVPDYAFHGLHDGTEFSVPVTLDPAIRAIHVGSIGAAFGPSAPALLRLLKSQQGRRLVCYDPNPRPSVIPDPIAWRARIAAIAACADLIKVSQEDLDFLYPGMSPEVVATGWLKGVTRLVVVTDGPSGARAFSSDRVVTSPGCSVRVADTVGAGDAFQSALLVACAAHRALDNAALGSLTAAATQRILSFAVQAGALACTRLGPAMPHRSELRRSFRADC